MPGSLQGSLQPGFQGSGSLQDQPKQVPSWNGSGSALLNIFSVPALKKSRLSLFGSL